MTYIFQIRLTIRQNLSDILLWVRKKLIVMEETINNQSSNQMILQVLYNPLLKHHQQITQYKIY
jgi:hypothetical protein